MGMVMRGKVCHWQDEKGFGFIQPESGSDKLFFHISSVKTTARRPEVGDSVLYDPTRDSQNRLRAKGVVIEGVSSGTGKSAESHQIEIEPPSKNAFDYISILVILGSLAAIGFAIYHTNSIERSWAYGVPAIVGLLILNRKRKPTQKHFTCARCRKVSKFGSRTIQAWNNGFLKLYCGTCHRHWLDNQARQQEFQTHGDRGCLGMLALIVLIPPLVGMSLYQWLM